MDITMQHCENQGENNENSPKINIAFRDLNYSVHCEKQDKAILKNISGEFKAGQISAILGPSGSGKTTLLNILAGYKITKVPGQVTINNRSRVPQHFHKISRYIMQENSLQPWLTVLDSMMIAADFKLDNRVSQKEKLQVVTGILKNLRLNNVKNSITEKLSGGERKRLAIALELINNPSILFLDEPTSGLDEQASYQCISVLKTLAEEGRTVICSIHSPSSKTFALFDHVYIVADGQCCYQGQGDQVISFLEKIQLTCPMYYNPIDFFMDVASDAYGEHLNRLVSLTQNGKYCYSDEVHIDNCDTIVNEKKDLYLAQIPEYYISTLSQVKVLMYRMFLQSYRNSSETKVKFVVFAITVIIFSSLYYGCGNDATKVFANINFLFLSIAALMYCALMPPLLHFPVEIKRIRSEHFNRWYNIQAYFIAKTLAIIPGNVISITLYVAVTYPLSDQPVSVDRMLKFIIVCIFVNLIADACSMAIASVLNIVNSFFVGVAVMIPPIGLAIFGYGFPFHLHPFIVQLMLRTSYLRYALEAVVDVVYGDRPEHLHCPDTEMLCPLTSPKVIIKVVGFGSMDYWTCVIALTGFYVVSKCGHYFLLKQRLRPGVPAQVALKAVEFGKSLLVKYLP